MDIDAIAKIMNVVDIEIAGLLRLKENLMRFFVDDKTL